MTAVKIIPDVYWVGAVDWNMRHFHGHTYTTKRGTTYNAYLIIDKKVALVDTVYKPFAREMIGNIKQLILPEKIDYIIINHIETDHSGALEDILKICPKAKVFGTAKTKDGLQKLYHGTMDFTVVKTGDTLSLGNKTLRFIEAPMIHWPDSMFTYVQEDALLLPNDAFGQHYATSERFDDEVDESVLFDEAVKYYASILWPLSPIILKKIEELGKMNIPLKIIAPSHGIIWRTNPQKIVNAYVSWSKNETQKKAIVFYETMWGATGKMAKAIAQGIIDAGISARLYDINQVDRTEVIKDMFESKGYCIGSSTHDNGMLPSIAGFLHFVKGLKPKGRVASVFGSYGWAGGAVKEIEQTLKEAGIHVVQPSLSIQYMPDEENLKKCYEYGKEFAQKIKEKGK